MKASIYETITNQIIAAIEAGADMYKMPWRRPRHDVSTRINAASGHSYRGVNVLSLWMTAQARGYASGHWATYQQWTEKGAQVRKGEKAASVMFWKDLRPGEDAAQAGDAERPQFVARGYSVFNAEQVDGFAEPSLPVLSEDERDGRAEVFFSAIPATVKHQGWQCAYMPSVDEIHMAPFGHFLSARDYYAVLSHELTHWSGAKDRLDRDLAGRFGSDRYAMEELVAELGAAFVTGKLGLPNDTRTTRAPYIASWLKVLKNDPRAIFTAAGKAQQAADYLAAFSVAEADD